jgi:hypothetical protein
MLGWLNSFYARRARYPRLVLLISNQNTVFDLPGGGPPYQRSFFKLSGAVTGPVYSLAMIRVLISMSPAFYIAYLMLDAMHFWSFFP